ncbi:MAG: twin-arginine translocase subunit TatC [Chloroflexi bacterium]|nr:twin-arginine translocase subunit TatC [Chloroflexota bacterium]MCH2308471.1 twin-arginine translocase subunit TatC [SAR202 cluster bacterium]MQG05170.1 twin-arginine translocase subunit TatC [SAR202 cluster bacterium]GIT15420.1 MAG: Sec-independent protein translocase protein TatC [Chloroflexota bacterium]
MINKKETLGLHLLELRRRLIWCLASVLVTTIIAFIFHNPILHFLMIPAQGAQSPLGLPIYTDLTEFVGAAIRVSLTTGIVLAWPLIMYQLAVFILPGLKSQEKKYVYFFLPLSTIVFFIGAYFGYKVLFPPAVNFLLHFGADVAVPYIRIGNYTSLMLTLILWMGIAFEMPVIVFFLSLIGIVTPKLLIKGRRYAIVCAFIVGAIITPTFDPVNQSIVALPLIVLYEAGILLARIGSKRKK